MRQVCRNCEYCERPELDYSVCLKTGWGISTKSSLCSFFKAIGQKQKIFLLAHKEPMEGRLMLGDIDWFEELDPTVKYTFFYNEELGLWEEHEERIDE